MTWNVTKQGVSPTPWHRETWRYLASAGYLRERITVFKTNIHYLSMCSFCLVYLVPPMDAAIGGGHLSSLMGKRELGTFAFLTCNLIRAMRTPF